jgi:capsular polysaccharide biosynthesis protein
MKSGVLNVFSVVMCLATACRNVYTIFQRLYCLIEISTSPVTFYRVIICAFAPILKPGYCGNASTLIKKVTADQDNYQAVEVNMSRRLLF